MKILSGSQHGHWHKRCVNKCMKAETPNIKPTGSFLERVSAKMSALFERLVPYGYEDENGFHYGMEPVSEFHLRLYHARSVHTIKRPMKTKKGLITFKHHHPASSNLLFEVPAMLPTNDKLSDANRI